MQNSHPVIYKIVWGTSDTRRSADPERLRRPPGSGRKVNCLVKRENDVAIECGWENISQ